MLNISSLEMNIIEFWLTYRLEENFEVIYERDLLPAACKFSEHKMPAKWLKEIMNLYGKFCQCNFEYGREKFRKLHAALHIIKECYFNMEVVKC